MPASRLTSRPSAVLLAHHLKTAQQLAAPGGGTMRQARKAWWARVTAAATSAAEAQGTEPIAAPSIGERETRSPPGKAIPSRSKRDLASAAESKSGKAGLRLRMAGPIRLPWRLSSDRKRPLGDRNRAAISLQPPLIFRPAQLPVPGERARASMCPSPSLRATPCDESGSKAIAESPQAASVAPAGALAATRRRGFRAASQSPGDGGEKGREEAGGAQPTASPLVPRRRRGGGLGVEGGVGPPSESRRIPPAAGGALDKGPVEPGRPLPVGDSALGDEVVVDPGPGASRRATAAERPVPSTRKPASIFSPSRQPPSRRSAWTPPARMRTPAADAASAKARSKAGRSSSQAGPSGERR